MDQLPDELLIDIFDYLEPTSIVNLQAESSRFSKLGRDNSLWRYKCFEKAPSASARTTWLYSAGHRHDVTEQPELADLTGMLGGLSLSDQTNTETTHLQAINNAPSNRGQRLMSRRAKAVTEWDCSDPTETVDWYSEYIARNAPVSADWLPNTSHSDEVRGLAAYADGSKAVGPLEDGTLCIWGIVASTGGRQRIQRKGQSESGMLFVDEARSGEPSKTKNPSFDRNVEVVNLDSCRNKAYIAIGDILKEVDLQTMQTVSRNRFAWPITALSQETDLDLALTVGTMWSLHLYDPRVPFRDRSRSPEDLVRSVPADPEDSVAFLGNHLKGAEPFSSILEGRVPPGLPNVRAPSLSELRNRDDRQGRSDEGRRRDMSDFARVEPGPLSILHHGENEIFIGGRFPSILSYDRRYFPRLQNVIHSGARISSLAAIPFTPIGDKSTSNAQATLVAAGEYGGRGSLELYSLPHIKTEVDSEVKFPYTYKNRQEASSSKLLSVASQGTRIVFSDSEGGIKWVERDGRGLSRRWNINAFHVNERGAFVSGESVIRKIIPLHTADSDRGMRGDGDLLVWTGEKIGIITTKPQWNDHDDLVQAFESKMDLNEKEEREKEEEYSRIMRNALERQADERRWMSRFRLRTR